MTRSQRNAIVAHVIGKWRLDAPPQHIKVIVAEAAESLLQLSKDASAEFADVEADQILAALVLAQEDLNRESRLCQFDFNSSSPELLQGSCFIQKNDSDAVRTAKRNRLHYEAFVDFLRNLSWREFEACCKGILEILGSSNPIVTKRGSDQGIDFYGKLSLQGRLDNASIFPSVDSNLEVWMVGQAKHYLANPISTPSLRELVGSVQLAKAETYADSGAALQGLSMRICDPVFYLFFTTGTISRDGGKLLRNSGMISMDGAQVAAFLADNSIGVTDGTFDPTAAQEWIQSHFE